MKYYILYNPLAANGKCAKNINRLVVPKGFDVVYCDITQIADLNLFLKEIPSSDRIIICGGDGTLNRFINKIDIPCLSREILYFALGSGNDFKGDVAPENANEPFVINDFLRNLPQISVGGENLYFLNGIGYGIDGYCCEERDRRKEKTSKPANYTLIALKGLLFAFKPRLATVIVDGIERHYKKVWMVPTMKGRFFGGGMMVAPDQDRNAENGELTVVVAHNLSKFMIVALFATIFKGKHTKFKKYVEIIKAKEVTVRFDKPCALQIDGETILNVSEYTVKANALVNAK